VVTRYSFSRISVLPSFSFDTIVQAMRRPPRLHRPKFDATYRGRKGKLLDWESSLDFSELTESQEAELWRVLAPGILALANTPRGEWLTLEEAMPAEAGDEDCCEDSGLS
jgi:hypothetical protein